MTVGEIALKGLASRGNDYVCEDGELAVCHNCVNDGGGLRGVETMEDGVPEIAGYRLVTGAVFKGLVFVHSTSDGKKYIGVGSDDVLYYYVGEHYGKEGPPWYWVSVEFAGGALFREGQYQISAVGNTLCVALDDGVHYILWKDGAYWYLGKKIPEIKIEFALDLYEEKDDLEDFRFRSSVEFFDSDERDHVHGEFKKTDPVDFAGATFDTILGKVNKMVADAWNKNLFTFPFFVRYAYVLYDGTLAMHSTPILMLPSTTVNPAICCLLPGPQGGHGLQKPVFTVDKSRCMLIQAMLLSRITSLPNGLDAWKDIVRGVNVYVSKQIYPYSPDGDTLTLGNGYRKNRGYSIGKVADTTFGGRRGTVTVHTCHKIMGNEMFRAPGYMGGSDTEEPLYTWLYLPEVEGSDVNTRIESAYNFYLFKSYEIEDLKRIVNSGNEFHEVETYKGALANIETRERMTDDYHSHDIIACNVINSYNNRINKANCRLYPFDNMPGEWLSCFSEGDTVVSGEVYLKDNGQATKVNVSEVSREPDSLSGYFFYPNPSAYLLKLSIGDNVYKLPLKTHPYLFGSYYFDDFVGIEDADDIVGIEYGNSYFSQPNYMYTSLADNPFVFPAQGVNAVGDGDIVALALATKAMSEGSQFGTMPMFAFCTDGIWALSVGDTGVFAAKQAVSRERLLGDDPKGLVEIDNSVLFLSERGLMELAGGQTRLLSGALEPDGMEMALPHVDVVVGDGVFLRGLDFNGYMRGARLAFDYVNYRAYVFRTYVADEGESHTAYVCDMRSGLWSTVENRMLSAVSVAPDTLVNVAGETAAGVMKFGRGGECFAGEGEAFFVTRPMKMGAADVVKTVRTLIERGRAGFGKLALWGSSDLEHWRIVAGARGNRVVRIGGTPYKFFVVAGAFRLGKGDAVSRLTMEIVPKYRNKLR